MAALNDVVTPSLTFEEILSDGSTLTNPAADGRRLFLGEDGLFHLKDSAGAVTGVGSSTTVATDTIWNAAGDLAVGSGSDTAARLAMGAEGSALSVMDGVVGWNGSTSMPSGPTTGQRVWRSDLNLEFVWDGTRWLCTCAHTLDIPPDGTLPVSASAGARQTRPHNSLGVYIVSFWCDTFVSTTNDGTNYWTLTLDIPAVTLSTVSNTPSTVVLETATVGAVWGSSWQSITITKVLSPGNAYFRPLVSYRLIGT